MAGPARMYAIDQLSVHTVKSAIERLRQVNADVITEAIGAFGSKNGSSQLLMGLK